VRRLAQLRSQVGLAKFEARQGAGREAPAFIRPGGADAAGRRAVKALYAGGLVPTLADVINRYDA
jgi:hypothetical protein